MSFSLESLIYFLVGSVITWYVTRAYSSVKRLHYWSESTPIFSTKSLHDVDGFEVSFRGKVVSAVFRHSIFFWNSGNQTIKREDIKETDRLRFVFRENSKASVDNILHDSDHADFELLVKQNEIIVSFEFIEPGDGFWVIVLEALYDDQIQADHRPQIMGHVVGLTEAIKRVDPGDLGHAKFNLKFGLGCLFIFLVALVGGAIWSAGMETVWPPSRNWLMPLLLTVVIAAATQAFGFFDFLKWRRLKVPNGFSQVIRWKYRQPEPLAEAIDEIAADFGKQ